MKSAALLLAALILSAVTPDSACAEGGEAVRCVITVKKVQLKSLAGEWVTLSDAEKEIDLASEQPEFTVENQGRAPAGEYTSFRVVISEKIRFAGVDGAHRTRQGGVIRIGGTAAKASQIRGMDVSAFEQTAPTWSQEDPPGEVTETLDLDHEDRDDVMEFTSLMGFPKPLPIKEKSSVTIRIGLFLKDAVHYAGANYFAGISSNRAVYFLPPKDVVEISFKADGNNRLVTSESIDWIF